MAAYLLICNMFFIIITMFNELIIVLPIAYYNISYSYFLKITKNFLTIEKNGLLFCSTGSTF